MKIEEKSNIISEDEFLKSLGIPVENAEALKLSEEVKTKEEPSEDDAKKNQDPEKTIEEDVKKPSEEDIKVEEEKSLKRFGVKDTINSLIENDIWSDIAIKFGDKEYESIEELLANEKPTRELFDSLSQVQKTLREEKLKEEYVS